MVRRSNCLVRLAGQGVAPCWEKSLREFGVLGGRSGRPTFVIGRDRTVQDNGTMASDGRVGSMACVGSRARQGEAKHGRAWHGVAWHWRGNGHGAWAWAWQLNNHPSRAGRPSLAVSKHGRRAEGGERARRARENQSVFVCVCARMSSDPQLTWKG